MEEQLYFIHFAFHVRIHAFVLMSNHFHLLISTPYFNLSEAMQKFMWETARLINLHAGRVNQLWGKRFRPSVITSPLYYLHAYKYIYRNPVEANICKSVLDYKYSTLSGLLGQTKLLIPANDTTLFDMGVDETLFWLDRQPEKKNWAAISKALKHPQFKLGKDKATNKPLSLETDML